MNKSRGIYPVDLLCLSAILVAFGAATIGAILTPQEWPLPKILTLAITDAMALGIVIVYYMEKWLARPDFVTKHGVAFWVADGLSVDKELMTRALDRFLDVVPVETTEVKREELEVMLSQTGVEWTKGTINLRLGQHSMKDKAGIQTGHRLIVQWKGSVASSAFYHELLHEVNEIIRLPRLPTEKAREEFRIQDIQHKEWDWWRLESALMSDF